MPYEIRKNEAEEFCVWKLEPDELLKCYSDQAEAGAYLAALSDATEYEEKARVGVDKYSTEEEALARADDIGCVGYHTLTEGGETIYMPCESHEFWLEQTGQNEEPEDEVAMVTSALELKAVTDDHFTVGGMGVVFGAKDLEGDTFAVDTDYMLDTVTEPIVLYDHAMEIKSVLGRVTKISKRDAGLWFEAQLDRAKDYAEQVLQLVKAGKLGYSTGSVAHLVERLEGNIKRWPIYELSLTPTPAEPRTLGVEYLKGLGVVIPANADAETMPSEGKTLEGDQPESATPERTVDAEVYAVTQNHITETDIMAEEVKVAPEATDEKPAAPVIDMDALREDVAHTVKDAVKASLAEEVEEHGGILTEAPKLKKETKMGGDHDGGDAFMHWVKTGSANYYTKSNLKAALQEGTATEGGVLVPQGLHETIIAKRDDLSVARAAGAMVIQTMVDSVQVPSENATGGFALTAEEGAANQDEPTFTSNAIQVYKFTNLTKVSDELLADEKTNLEGFLGDMWARSAADVENEYFLKGTGSSQPKGVLVGGTAALTLDSATTIAASEIPELYYLLPGAYAQEGDAVAWATNQSTLGVIRGLTGNDFLFMPTPMGEGSRGAGQMLYGAPVYTSSQILAMATGRSVIVVGNWRYYGIVERNEIVISRNPYLYQGNGQVGFFVNIRFGGDVLQAEAFQYAQNA